MLLKNLEKENYKFIKNGNKYVLRAKCPSCKKEYFQEEDNINLEREYLFNCPFHGKLYCWNMKQGDMLVDFDEDMQ